MAIFLGPRLWNPEADHDLDLELDTRHCPVCVAEGCAACAGTGRVLAADEDEAALVAFRSAAARFLHPSGFGDR